MSYIEETLVLPKHCENESGSANYDDLSYSAANYHKLKLQLLESKMTALHGRINSMPIKRLSSIPLSSIDSNTVAVLFVNRGKVEGLMSFMRTALSKQTNLPQTDLILDNWSRANRYYRLFTIPSLFQHTGIISSKPWKSHGLHRINPHSKNEIYELLYKHVKTSRTFDGFKLE